VSPLSEPLQTAYDSRVSLRRPDSIRLSPDAPFSAHVVAAFTRESDALHCGPGAAMRQRACQTTPPRVDSAAEATPPPTTTSLPGDADFLMTGTPMPGSGQGARLPRSPRPSFLLQARAGIAQFVFAFLFSFPSQVFSSLLISPQHPKFLRSLAIWSGPPRFSDEILENQKTGVVARSLFLL
jgi:hypothetical protein